MTPFDGVLGASSENCLAKLPKLPRIGLRFRPQALRLLQRARGNQANAYLLAVLRLKLVLHLLPRHFELPPANFLSAIVGQIMSLAYCSGVMFRSCFKSFFH